VKGGNGLEEDPPNPVAEGGSGEGRELPLMPCPANRFDHNPLTTSGKRAQSVCASFHRFNMQHKKIVCLYYRRGKRRHTHPGGMHTLFSHRLQLSPAAFEASDHLRLPSTSAALSWVVLGCWLLVIGWGLGVWATFVSIRDHVRALTSRRQPDIQ